MENVSRCRASTDGCSKPGSSDDQISMRIGSATATRKNRTKNANPAQRHLPMSCPVARKPLPVMVCTADVADIRRDSQSPTAAITSTNIPIEPTVP